MNEKINKENLHSFRLLNKPFKLSTDDQFYHEPPVDEEKLANRDYRRIVNEFTSNQRKIRVTQRAMMVVAIIIVLVEVGRESL